MGRMQRECGNATMRPSEGSGRQQHGGRISGRRLGSSNSAPPGVTEMEYRRAMKLLRKEQHQQVQQHQNRHNFLPQNLDNAPSSDHETREATAAVPERASAGISVAAPTINDVYPMPGSLVEYDTLPPALSTSVAHSGNVMPPHSRQLSLPEQAIDAAALQTDMARRFNLNNPSSLIRQQRRLLQQHQRSDTAKSEGNRAQRTARCGSCNAQLNLNVDVKLVDGRPVQHSTEAVCGNCGFFIFCLAEQQPVETFAQKRGLVPKPERTIPLSPFQWQEIEATINRRAEPDAFCPICMEGFSNRRYKERHELDKGDVLLSCTHIFHRACLRSFERFMQQSADGSGGVVLNCPICRTRNYQKKITSLGSAAYQRISARRVQSMWRGYCARKHYRSALRSYYRDTSTVVDMGRRKKFYENEFTQITERINRNFHNRSGQVDSMLSSLDRTLIESRQLDAMFEQMLQQRLQQPHQQHLEDSMLVNESNLRSGNADGSCKAKVERSESSNDSGGLLKASADGVCIEANGTSWLHLLQQSLGRGCDDDCPICMLPVVIPSTVILLASTSSLAPVKVEECVDNTSHNLLPTRRNVLLSCTHIFHEQCIKNFETFVSASVNPTCPVCRSKYSKRLLE